MSSSLSPIAGRSFPALEAKAAEASEVLAAMANPRRLIALCRLLEGETSVGELAEAVSLSQAALSQHLARLRALRIVETRRVGNVIFYRIASDKVKSLLLLLYDLYCIEEC